MNPSQYEEEYDEQKYPEEEIYDIEPMAEFMPFIDLAQDLIDIAATGGTATLTGDITIETGGGIPWRLHVLHAENDMVIDLNGHTLTVRAGLGPTNAIMIDSGNTLTIRDSVGGGELYHP